ncbi:MAG: hypothetical protein AAF902_07340 [Chloroflexota bacterium]
MPKLLIIQTSPSFDQNSFEVADKHIQSNGHESVTLSSVKVSEFEDLLISHHPDIVAIEVEKKSRAHALALAAIGWDASVPVVVFGSDPADDPIWYLANPEFDIVVHSGLGETLVALLNLTAEGNLLNPIFLKHELGIAYRDSFGGPIVNEPRSS